MFEFWNDLLNDKTTFIVTILIPIGIACFVFIVYKIFVDEQVFQLDKRVKKLENFQADLIKKELE